MSSARASSMRNIFRHAFRALMPSRRARSGSQPAAMIGHRRPNGCLVGRHRGVSELLKTSAPGPAANPRRPRRRWTPAMLERLGARCAIGVLRFPAARLVRETPRPRVRNTHLQRGRPPLASHRELGGGVRMTPASCGGVSDARQSAARSSGLVRVDLGMPSTETQHKHQT